MRNSSVYVSGLANSRQWISISDMLEVQGQDNVVAETTEALAESMRDALDLVTRDVLVAGTNVQYAGVAATRGGASGVGSGMYLSMAELREAKRTLARNNIPPIRSEGNKYVVITHPDAIFDLEAETSANGLISILSQAGPRGDNNQLFDVMFTDLPFGFRVYTTTNVRVFASLGLSGGSVYITHVLGEEAFATVKLSAMPAAIIRHERGSGGVADPLDQYSTIGWKAAHTAVITNQNAALRIEHVTSFANAA